MSEKLACPVCAGISRNSPALAAAQAEVARLTAALKPFAKMTDSLEAMMRFTGGGPINPKTVVSDSGGALPSQLYWSDFLAARAALEPRP